jgi:hypothetical protein
MRVKTKKFCPYECLKLLATHNPCQCQAQEKLVMYALQSLQAYPQAMMENNANQPMEWKEIAICEELEQLKPHVHNTSRRIINQDNLEVVYIFKQHFSSSRMQFAEITARVPELPG